MFNQPSRAIPKNYRNITGKFSSIKSDRLLSYESKLERDFLYIYELDNFIIKIVEQPLTIEYAFENKKYSYTPDFYLKTPENFNDIIVEVKYYSDLKTIFSESKRKYKAMVKYLEDENIDFVFHTDRCPYIQNATYLFNAHFLLNYNEIDDEHHKFIFKTFFPYIIIQDLLESYSNDAYEQLSLLTTIWTMIRKKILIVDLFQKLTTNAPLLQLRQYDEKQYELHLQGKIKQGYLL